MKIFNNVEDIFLESLIYVCSFETFVCYGGQQGLIVHTL